ncbi:MAG TPA: polysaccharide deacetylase family protein [Actinomycetota bacterium]
MRGPIVLAYHGVGRAADDTDPTRLITSPRHLESQVRLLRRLGYRFATAEQVLAGSGGDAPPDRTAVLTFDDGFRSWLTDALPLLQRLGIRATFYVCPGWLGGHHPEVAGEEGRLLDADDARALVGAGMELGSHAMAHADLRELDDEALRDDLASSKAGVEELTGRPCRTLAYPFGLFGEREERAAAEAGYELAFGWWPGPWRRFAAPRLPGPPRHGAARLAAKLMGVRRRG